LAARLRAAASLAHLVLPRPQPLHHHPGPAGPAGALEHARGAGAGLTSGTGPRQGACPRPRVLAPPRPFGTPPSPHRDPASASQFAPAPRGGCGDRDDLSHGRVSAASWSRRSSNRDFPVVQGVVLVVSLIFVAVERGGGSRLRRLRSIRACARRRREAARASPFWLSAGAVGVNSVVAAAPRRAAGRRMGRTSKGTSTQRLQAPGLTHPARHRRSWGATSLRPAHLRRAPSSLLVGRDRGGSLVPGWACSSVWWPGTPAVGRTTC